MRISDLKILVFVMWTAQVMGQQGLQHHSDVTHPSAYVSTESVFIHINNSLIFSGEYLYYSVYCLNDNSKQMSDLSKVVYVQLIGKNSEELFFHKLGLESGRANSEYFVPVEIPTGNYKLIGYTSWMRNEDLDEVFIADLTIINPYKTNKETYVSGNSEKDAKAVGLNQIEGSKSSEDGSFLMETDKSHYRTRDRVSLHIVPVHQDGVSHDATVSLSIRKINSIPAESIGSATEFIKKIEPDSILITTTRGNLVLPELRGELFKGQISSAQDSPNKRVGVSVSVPGSTDAYKVLESDSTGIFHFNLSHEQSGRSVFFRILDKGTDLYNIKLFDSKRLKIPGLQFAEFEMKPEWRDDLEKRSVHNQIENAYFEFRPDSLISIKKSTPLFPDKEHAVYKLDDYTRFSTLKETVVEIIQHVFVKRVGANSSRFLIQSYDFGTESNILPLVLINGVAIENHDALMAFSSKVIDTISVYRDQYVIGTKLYQGVMDIRADLYGYDVNLIDQAIVKDELLRTRPRKNYFFQGYSDGHRDSRIPDYRRQLSWIPQLKIEKGSTKEIHFFTSDISGSYQIRLEGFTSNGDPISIQKIFTVD